MLGFPGGSAGKESTCNAGDLGSIPGLGRSPGEGNGYPLQYSDLENSMYRRAWKANGVAKSRTPLSNFHFHLTLCFLLLQENHVGFFSQFRFVILGGRHSVGLRSFSQWAHLYSLLQDCICDCIW